MKLLSIANDPKTIKGESKGYKTAVMYLAPHKLSGVNLCPMAEAAGCYHACLNTAGLGGVYSSIQKARLNRAKFFNEDREGFLTKLHREIQAFIRKADREGLIPTIRLNGLSDIRWENLGVIESYPDMQFYDYTKLTNRRNIPDNYHLTWSYSEHSKKYAKLAEKIRENISVVFRGPFPDEYIGRRVINGDEHDLRFLDPENVVVGLKAKGRGIHEDNGFVIHTTKES